MNIRLKRAFSYIFALAIIAFIVRSLYADIGLLGRVAYDFRWPWLVISGLLVAATMGIYALIWRGIVHRLSGRKFIPASGAMRTYFLAQTARYLPGKVFNVVSLVALSRRYGVSGQIAAVSAVYEIVLIGIAVFLLPALLLGYDAFRGLMQWYVPMIIIAAGAIVLHPRALAFAFRMAQRTGRLDPSVKPIFLPYTDLIRLIIAYAFAMLVNGAGFYGFMFAFVPDIPVSFIHLTAYFTLANGLGMLAIFAPGGLGVREGFLAYFLRGFISGALAAFLALALRVWTTLIEIIVVLLFWSLARSPKESYAQVPEKI